MNYNKMRSIIKALIMFATLFTLLGCSNLFMSEKARREQMAADEEAVRENVRITKVGKVTRIEYVSNKNNQDNKTNKKISNK